MKKCELNADSECNWKDKDKLIVNCNEKTYKFTTAEYDEKGNCVCKLKEEITESPKIVCGDGKCEGNKKCLEGKLVACDKFCEGNECVECRADNDCKGATPICDSKTKSCRTKTEVEKIEETLSLKPAKLQLSSSGGSFSIDVGNIDCEGCEFVLSGKECYKNWNGVIQFIAKAVGWDCSPWSHNFKNKKLSGSCSQSHDGGNTNTYKELTLTITTTDGQTITHRVDDFNCK